MPMIQIEYDDKKLTEEQMNVLSVAAKKIVSSVTGIEDVFVYANSARIKVAIAPVEIFVSISQHKVGDMDSMFQRLKTLLSEWRKKSEFPE